MGTFLAAVYYLEADALIAFSSVNHFQYFLEF
jgi:hypothetical protein